MRIDRCAAEVLKGTRIEMTGQGSIITAEKSEVVDDKNNYLNALEQLAPNLGEQEKELLAKLISILRGMQYGHILITVHDSAIVQIDKTEKIRFPKSFCKNCKHVGGDDHQQ